MKKANKILVAVATVLSTIGVLSIIRHIIRKKSAYTDAVLCIPDEEKCERCGEFCDIPVDDYMSEEDDINE